MGLAINDKHEVEQSFDADVIVLLPPCLLVFLYMRLCPDYRGSQEAILIHHRV